MGRGGKNPQRIAPTDTFCTMKLNEITIEITQQCPNRCVHCSSLSCPNKTTCLATETILSVIDDAVALGCESISLSGGEPFLHIGLRQIVDYIAKYAVQCNIYTSGICFVGWKPCSVPTEILKELRGKVSKYVVNVEAADEETYDNIMGTSFNGFAMMKQFISDAVALGETVEAHFVPMKPNYKQIPAVVEMCNKLGVSNVSFLRFVAQGRGLENVKELLLNEEEMREARSLMKESYENNNAGIRLGIPFMECSNRVNCLTGISKLNIRYDGNVYPCEAFKNDQPVFISHAQADNVNEICLSDIYANSVYLQQIREMLDKYQSCKTCETCLAQFLSYRKEI